MESPSCSLTNVSQPLLSKSNIDTGSLQFENEKMPSAVRKPSDVVSVKPLSHISHLNGLRALAFIGVLIFHFRRGCQGGFLGVDVFFVLSGYLMTRSITLQIAHGHFSYVSFLSRRFWRLYPALLCTILATLLASYAFLSPYLVSQIARSAEASAASWSNALFMRDDSYFGTSSALKPLLHTWSLSLEWQFYSFWPILLLLLARSSAYVRPIWPLSLLCIFSFAYGVSIAPEMPQAAFFMLPGRVFEFGFGALLHISPPVTDVRIGNVMSLSGTLMIIVSFTQLNSNHGAPAVIALPALFGAMLVIASPSRADANLVYNSALLDYVGKISYSAYLVHWPAFVFYHNIYEHVPAPWFVEAAVFVAIFIMSAAMFHCVEDEFRKGNKHWHKPIGVSLMLFVVVVSWNAKITDGWEMRLPAISRTGKKTHIMQDARDIYRPHEKIFWPSGSKNFKKSEPDYGMIPSDSGRSIENRDKFDALIVGDSFAGPLAGVFSELARDLKNNYLLLSHAACLPVFDDISLNPNITDYINAGHNERAELCKTTLRPNMLKLIRAANTDVVVLAGNWVGGHHIWEPGFQTTGESSMKSAQSKRSRFEDSISKLRNWNKKVVVIGSTPCAHFHVRECLAAAGPLSGLKHCPTITRIAKPFLGTESEQRRQKRRVEVRDQLNRLIKSSPVLSTGVRDGWVSYVDPFNTYCKHTTGECVLVRDGKSIYSDTEHLTANGTIFMKGAIRSALKAVA